MPDEEIKENVTGAIEKAKKHPAVFAIGGSAVAGAIIGSFLPVIGTAIGAGIGGIVGSIGVIAKAVRR